MESVSVNQFRENLKTFVEQVVTDHTALMVTRRAGDDFVVQSADDWSRDQETIHVLQNSSMMKQIESSTTTHKNQTGYKPSRDEIDAIIGL